MDEINRKIIVDIVNPYGGYQGGIEDVIRSWTQNLNNTTFDVRVMHMTPGTNYLDGYEKAYYLKEEKAFVDASYCASGYNLLISQLGPPDICIATAAPFVTLSCDKVREFNNLHFSLFSWVHNEISRYESTGNGGVREMINADYHLAISSSIANDIIAYDNDAIVYTIGNPIIHTIPSLDSKSQYIPNKLVYVGRLAPPKRLDLILEALVKCKSKWSLDIIGDGEIRKDVEGWITLLNLRDQVRLLGWKENPLEYMKDAVALVSASDYEGLPITNIEALAMGKMIISTPNQGANDIVIEGVNGYFFGFDDSSGLANILDRLSSHTLTVPTHEACKKTVEQFQKENYFINLQQILINAYSHEKEPR